MSTPLQPMKVDDLRDACRVLRERAVIVTTTDGHRHTGFLDGLSRRREGRWPRRRYVLEGLMLSRFGVDGGGFGSYIPVGQVAGIVLNRSKPE